ncbi:hypothetical protein BZL30_3474 [Mycobacterium kansasii]|uniref:Uncharacterized protein n=1 Tax=Mycobacterium kansasii TaxID=1768 RepID=A0A1V3XAB7_MYCKA|nr:hypothetical protein BZL30_3474 [Mycobacterium kansasii]
MTLTGKRCSRPSPNRRTMLSPRNGRCVLSFGSPVRVYGTRE